MAKAKPKCRKKSCKMAKIYFKLTKMLNRIAMIPNTERMNFIWQKEISETINFTGS